VSARTEVLIKVEASGDIRMPVRGIGANDSSYLVGADVRLGPTLGVPLQQVLPIGSFLGTELSIIPKVATVSGLPVSIRIRFTLNPELVVAAGEEIFLVLPRFRGHNNGTYDVLAETVGDYIIRIGPRSGQVFRTFSCTWSNKTERLSFIANTQVSGVVDITVPKESLLALPAVGTVENSTAFLLGTNAALGSSAGQPVLKSPSIGSFAASSVGFINARAGGVADIQLNFSLVNVIQAYETVSFRLPGFSAANISSWTLRQAVNLTVNWNNQTKILTLTFLHSIQGSSVVHVTVPASSNIALPPGGLRADHPITVATNAQSGPVDEIPVLSVPPIGDGE
jgi:hypothetical protein